MGILLRASPKHKKKLPIHAKLTLNMQHRKLLSLQFNGVSQAYFFCVLETTFNSFFFRPSDSIFRGWQTPLSLGTRRAGGKERKVLPPSPPPPNNREKSTLPAGK